MSKSIMDTQELEEIRAMLADMDDAPAEKPAPAAPMPEMKAEKPAPVQEAPAPATQEAPAAPVKEDTFNLDEILSEVGGVVDRRTADKARDRKVEAQVHRPKKKKEEQAPAEETRQIAPEKPKKTAPVKLTEPEEDEYEDELDPRDEAREARRARKEAAREKKRALRDENRVSHEEDEEIILRTPRQAQATCARRAKSLASRGVIVLLMAVIALYLTLADGLGLPLPAKLSFKDSTILSVLALLVTQFIAMFAGIDVVGLGFYNLFTFRPDRRDLVSAALLASMVHGLTIILSPGWEAYLPYCAVSIILLYAAMIEEKNRLSARYRVFKAVSLTDTPTMVYSRLDPEDRPRRAVKYHADSNEAFLRELEKPDYAERFGRIYVPIALLAAVAFAVISSIMAGKPERFFVSLSVILSVSAPLGVLCAAGKPYKNVSRKLLGDGAALAGACAAQKLRAAREAILYDHDLFPAGAVTIDRIHNFGVYPDEKLLAYVAAITCGEDLEIGRVFAEALHKSYGRPVRATNILRYEFGGMSADIGSDGVMVGTAAFLTRMGLRLRDNVAAENGLFVVVNSRVAGLFDLHYHPSAQAYGGVHTLRRVGVRPVLASRDFNLSPAMLESLFELKHGTFGEAGERAAAYSDPSYADGLTPGALLSRDGITPYANVMHAADKLAGAVRSNLILGAFAGISGMLIMFYLTYLGEFAVLTPDNVLLYLLLWFIPVVFITFNTKRND